MTWNKRWMDLAKTVAGWSKDPSTKVGAVIIDSREVVRALGWNGIPRGVTDVGRDTRPEKYLWYEHAERNAIYNAASTGTPLEGTTLFTTLPPCSDCARAIIQSGIKKVVTTRTVPNENWNEHWDVAHQMFEEAGIELEMRVD